MQIDEKKLVELVAAWERVPVGVEGDEVQVVLAHEATGHCATQLKKLMLESAESLVREIAPANGVVVGVTHDIAQ